MTVLLPLTRSVVPSLLHLVRKKERETVAFLSHGNPYRSGRITLAVSQGSSLAAFSSYNSFLCAVEGLLVCGKVATAIPIEHPICGDSRLPLSLQMFI